MRKAMFAASIVVAFESKRVTVLRMDATVPSRPHGST
jgi:hypothetical protein